MSRRALALALAALGALDAPRTAPLEAGELPDAVLLLESAPGTPGSDPAGAPPRFALLRDGQVFVGGSSRVEAGRLERREAQALEKRAAALRRLAGISEPLALGGPPALTHRLRLLGDEPLEASVSGLDAFARAGPGSAASAPAALVPLATLVAELARFDHPSLRPYAPSAYAIGVREARLAGGCRAWSFGFPIADALRGARSVTAAEAEGWPTGAMPASVCVDDRRYAVTLRPLLPGEQP